MASERRSKTFRLEGFSDAVFAFALTLLVVSLQVPSSYDEFVHTLRRFIAFAPSFAALIWIWCLHREFFRRYGLGDGPMVVLNAVLIFVVLVYVYPPSSWRRSCLAALRSDEHRAHRGAAAHGARRHLRHRLRRGVRTLRAHVSVRLRKRHVLHLTRLDLFEARYALEANGINILTGLGSIALPLLGAPPASAGLFYLVLGPVRAVHGVRSGAASPR